MNKNIIVYDIVFNVQLNYKIKILTYRLNSMNNYFSYMIDLKLKVGKIENNFYRL
jgi:hypothetical protein